TRMDERMRRQWAGAEAVALGRGGLAAVSRATGLALNTIKAGRAELAAGRGPGDTSAAARIRRPGGGRKPITRTDPGLREALLNLVDPATRGHPQSPLLWSSKSTRKLAVELARQGHPVSDRTVAALLKAERYSLQANRKTREGSSHPDRDAQFGYINEQATLALKAGRPVVSVDTKKKELVGEFKNSGQEWQPRGQPLTVNVHDFPDPKRGKAIPYGVHDLAHDEGWVSVGTNHDTAEFAAASIGRWWREMGRRRFPKARRLMITADGGGSNSSRSRLWKVALQALADDIRLELQVCHFPPGTSKWNKIEHRLFCFITRNWRGRPLVSYQAIVNLIASTTSTKGLTVRAALDDHDYPTGRKVTPQELATLCCVPAEFHGEWNYTIRPRA
ncbi:MAG: ISAzo13 family transposase, partial [Phycisphaeraceae bacterium]|nr:ISAzo13 family transposase [Phycisphaeraceae bacterium]